MTTFAQQGSALISALTQIINSGGTLFALLVSAVAIDPMASLVVIGVVAALGSVLRPLRSAVKRQAGTTAVTGMSFATMLSETSQLGQELHVFGVQGEAASRVDALIEENESAARRLAFIRGMVPAIYNGLAYLALVGAIGVVAAVGGVSLASVGAVILIMLRSLSYGQAMQTSITSVNAALHS